MALMMKYQLDNDRNRYLDSSRYRSHCSYPVCVDRLFELELCLMVAETSFHVGCVCCPGQSGLRTLSLRSWRTCQSFGSFDTRRGRKDLMDMDICDPGSHVYY